MHVGVGAVVVGKDKAARGGMETKEEKKKKSQPEAYQSALNCFIITEMHRHNLLLKIMQSLISRSSVNTVVCLCECVLRCGRRGGHSHPNTLTQALPVLVDVVPC